VFATTCLAEVRPVSATALRPDPREIDYWGGCPVCWRHDSYLNEGRVHGFICRRHKTKWNVGENLFSTWIEDPSASTNWLLLSTYREVEPVQPPPMCCWNGCDKEPVPFEALCQQHLNELEVHP
jgi:hypothetical protein